MARPRCMAQHAVAGNPRATLKKPETPQTTTLGWTISHVYTATITRLWPLEETRALGIVIPTILVLTLKSLKT